VPRELGDVLDYFLPTSSPRVALAARDDASSPEPPQPLRDQRRAALPIVGLPIGDRDVVRAAFAWNLAVEIARRGASASLLAPAGVEASALWPEAGPGPVGAEVILSEARSLPELNRAALDLAVTRAAELPDAGLVLVRIPPAWLGEARDGRALLRWVLLFASTDRRDLAETYGIAKQVLRSGVDRRVGVTIHGARRIAEAERAFHQLADVSSRHLGRSLVSYGLLVDDLHVYRAIVSRRPVGLEHPQSRAARALGDVARLLVEDAQEMVRG